jgi:hypothetical protein
MESRREGELLHLVCTPEELEEAGYSAGGFYPPSIDENADDLVSGGLMANPVGDTEVAIALEYNRLRELEGNLRSQLSRIYRRKEHLVNLIRPCKVARKRKAAMDKFGPRIAELLQKVQSDVEAEAARTTEALEGPNRLVFVEDSPPRSP